MGMGERWDIIKVKAEIELKLLGNSERAMKVYTEGKKGVIMNSVSE